MRRYEDLCREPGYYLWPLISEITKPLIAAKNFSLLAETGFFNRIGRKSPIRPPPGNGKFQYIPVIQVIILYFRVGSTPVVK
jgi:hypothetical protein